MRRSTWVLGLIFLNPFLSLQVKASELSFSGSQAISTLSSRSSCSDILRFEHYVEDKFQFGGNNKYSYHRTTSPESGKAHLTKYILPSIPENNRLMVVVDGVHTYIQYKGHRIDSRGEVGRAIESFVKPARAVSGDVAFVIHGLSSETKASLDKVIQNKESSSALTCAAVTCNILRDAAENVTGKHWSTTALIDSLITASMKGKDVEIVSLSGKSPWDISRAAMIKEEKYHPNPWLVLGAVALPVYYLGQLLM